MYDEILVRLWISKTWWRHQMEICPRYWPFVRGIHQSSANHPHKGQWREALMFALICAWINGWVNNHETGVLRRHRTHCDVIVMVYLYTTLTQKFVRTLDYTFPVSKIRKIIYRSDVQRPAYNCHWIPERHYNEILIKTNMQMSWKYRL